MMNHRWATSDPYYDARQSAEQQTPITLGNPNPPEGDQRPKIRTINDRPNDDGDGMREKRRNHHTEIDREYAIFVANTRPRECNITGDLNIEGDQDISPLIVKPLSHEGDAMHDNVVQDRQARNVDNGREQENRHNLHTEFDQEYSMFVANTFLRECNIPSKENGELNIVRDVVESPLIVNVRRRVLR